MVYTLLFSSSKCSLFHNYNAFGSCIIHILYTWYILSVFSLQNAVCIVIKRIWFLYYSHFIYRCAKIKKKSGAKRWKRDHNIRRFTWRRNHICDISVYLWNDGGFIYNWGETEIAHFMANAYFPCTSQCDSPRDGSDLICSFTDYVHIHLSQFCKTCFPLAVTTSTAEKRMACNKSRWKAAKNRKIEG